MSCQEAINSTQKQDFLAKSLSPPTLSTVEYSSRYLLFISHIFGHLFLNWLSTRVYIHESQGPRLERNFRHWQKAKTWWTWRVISIIAENKPCMLITRLICIKLSPMRRDSYPQLPRSLLATPGSMTSLWRAHTKKKKKKKSKETLAFLESRL